MEVGTSCSHSIGHLLDGRVVGLLDRIAENNAQVDIAHQGTEATMCEAA